jgi:hypothetical protein
LAIEMRCIGSDLVQGGEEVNEVSNSNHPSQSRESLSGLILICWRLVIVFCW